MPGGYAGGPFRSRSSPSSSVASSGGRSVRSGGGRSAGGRSASSLGGSSCGSGARRALKKALSATELRDVAGKLGQEASQKHGSLPRAFKSMSTDNRGRVSRSELQSFCGDLGVTRREIDRLFETLDVAKEGTINLEEFKGMVAQGVQAAPSDTIPTERGPQCPPSAEKRIEEPSIASKEVPSQDVPAQPSQQIPKASDARTVETPAEQKVPEAWPDQARASQANGVVGTPATARTSKKIQPHILDNILEDVSHQISSRHGNLQRAFHDLDTRRVRKLNLDDFRRPVIKCGYDESVARQLFNHIDKDKSGALDFKKFQSLFSHAMHDWDGRKGKPRTASAYNKEEDIKQAAKEATDFTAVVEGPPKPLTEQQVKHVFDEVATTTTRNCKSVRSAFMYMNNLGKNGNSNKDGISRDKLQYFMKLHGYHESHADQVFDHLDKDGSGLIDYQEFQHMFGPYIMPDWIEKKENTDRALPLEPPPPIADRELKRIVDNMGRALRGKYGSAHDCFRTLDVDGSGHLDRTEVRDFFARFAFDKKTADRFFDYVDKDKSGVCERSEFASYFTPYIVQGFDPFEEHKDPRRVQFIERLEAPKKIADPELAKAVENVGAAVGSRFKTIQRAFRIADEDKDGALSREETRLFFKNYGYSDALGDKFFDFVNQDGSDQIDYREFQSHFAPHVYGWSQLGQEGVHEYYAKDCEKADGARRIAYSSREDTTPQPSERAQQQPGSTPPRKPSSDASRTPSEASRTPRQLTRADAKSIFQDVATATARHNSSVRKAFTTIQGMGKPGRTAGITLDKFQDYMKTLGYDDSVSAQIFGYVDQDGGGSIAYKEFQELFGPYIMPDWTVREEKVDRAWRTEAPPIQDKKLRQTIKQLGIAVAKKFGSAHACFRTLDTTGNGSLSKEEVREFFDRFAFPKESADAFYANFQRDRDGDIGFNDFASYFTPYIHQGYDFDHANMESAPRQQLERPQEIADPGLAAAVAHIGEAAGQRFGHSIRKTWRTIDLDKDGLIDRREMQDFFRIYGYSKDMANRFFDLLKPVGDEVSYPAFQSHLAPHILGYPRLGQEGLDPVRGAHYNRCDVDRARENALGKASSSTASTASTPPRSMKSGLESAREQPRSAKVGFKEPPEVSSCVSRPGSDSSHHRLTQHEVKQVFHDIATTTARHKDSVRKAFIDFNPRRNGGIDRRRLKEYMEKYGYDESTSHQVFDYIDNDGTGEISYKNFRDSFGPYIMPDWIDKNAGRVDRGIPPPAPEFKDKKMRSLIRNLGTEVAKRYGSAHQCFRTLDTDNSGTLTKDEVREFFSRFAYAPEVADEFYSKLEQDGDGEVNLREFSSYFTPYIVQGYDGQPALKESKSELEALPCFTKRAAGDKELNDTLAGLASACKSRFGTIRDAWRTIDLDKDGKIDKNEIRHFFDTYGYDKKMAKKFSEMLGANESGEISYQDFQSNFAPLIYGYSQLGQEGGIAKHRAASAPASSRVGRVPRREAADDRRYHDAAGRGGENKIQQEANSAAAAKGFAQTPRVSDRELKRVASDISEKMRAKHGGSVRSAFRYVASNHKDYVTRDDVQKLFRNYGHFDAADQFFDRLDGDRTGGVDFLAFQRLFAPAITKPESTMSGQTSYRSAFG